MYDDASLKNELFDVVRVVDDVLLERRIDGIVIVQVVGTNRPQVIFNSQYRIKLSCIGLSIVQTCTSIGALSTYLQKQKMI